MSEINRAEEEPIPEEEKPVPDAEELVLAEEEPALEKQEEEPFDYEKRKKEIEDRYQEHMEGNPEDPKKPGYIKIEKEAWKSLGITTREEEELIRSNIREKIIKRSGAREIELAPGEKIILELIKKKGEIEKERDVALAEVNGMKERLKEEKLKQLERKIGEI